MHRLARLPFLPVLKHVDARIAALSGQQQALREDVARLHADVGGWTNFWGARHEQNLLELREFLRAQTQATLQSGAFVERAAEEVAGAMARLEQTRTMAQDTAGMAAPPPPGNEPAARAGLWFNPPVVLKREGRDVTLDQIHERIVEIPFAFRALAGLAPGATVLDVGSAESTVAFSLACLGLLTTAIDHRGYPFQHANLRVVAEDVAVWAGPGEGSLDAVVCLSTLEHLGLQAYDGRTLDPDLDRKVLARFLRWLKPGGLLVLTVPYGLPVVDTFERTYDRDQLDRLLASGWAVVERAVFARQGPTEWTRRDETRGSWPADERGVALIRAVKA